jgi:glycosyltransferase involved in cell wall biosynthesis
VLLRPLLEKRGHEVKVLASTARSDAPHFNDYEFKGTGTSKMARYCYATFNPHSYAALKKILKDFRPDIVTLNTMAQPSPSILFLLKKYPTVLTLHGPEAFMKNLLPWYLPLSDFKDGDYNLKRLRAVGKMRYYWIKYILGFIYYFGLRNVDQVISVSSYMQRLAAEEGMSTLTIPNGTALLEYQPLEKGHIKNILVYAGRLEKFKGVDYLICAMPRIVHAFPDAHLFIAGDGTAKDDLVRLVKRLDLGKNITFLGHLSRKDLELLYRQAAMVIMPSIWPEAFGKIGIEAMSVGRPIIASNVGGISDWLVDGETGFLVPPKDSDAICRAVIRLLSDRGTLISMGRASRKRAEEFDLEKYADRIEEVYIGLVERYRQKRT